MRGSIIYQVNKVFDEVRAFGESRHNAKDDAREILEARGETVNPHTIAKETGVHSYGAADTYRGVWSDLLSYAKEFESVKDIEKLSGETVRNFVDAKINEGLANSTIAKICAACEKLEVALNRYSEHHGKDARYDFSGPLQEARDRAATEATPPNQESRAYADVTALVGAITNPTHQLAAQLQAESGCRITEASLIRGEQLRSIGTDRITGETRGQIEIQGKGGRYNTIQISPETYARLEAHIQEHGEFKFRQNSYRADLRIAAEKTGQRYTGSHGLRWSYAASRMDAAQEHGHCYEGGMSETSQDLGHSRASITEHYLR